MLRRESVKILKVLRVYGIENTPKRLVKVAYSGKIKVEVTTSDIESVIYIKKKKY